MGANTSNWRGGWYQPIEFPNGEKTHSKRYDDETFHSRESLGRSKWDLLIEPNLPEGDRFLEIGCNAGLYLVLASEKYKEVYGVDSEEIFLSQAEEVLRRFNESVYLIQGDALEMDLPSVDVTLMANVLYWLIYTDENGYREGWEERIERFFEKLDTKWLVAVGAEDIERFGGKLDLTLPIIKKHFEVEKAEISPLKDRTLNIIVCRK